MGCSVPQLPSSETGRAAKQAVVRTRPAFCLETHCSSHSALLAVGLLLISLLEVKGRDVLVLSTRSLGARSGLDSGQGHLCSKKLEAGRVIALLIQKE